jgi:CDP-glucose 4,6-dehydratase
VRPWQHVLEPLSGYLAIGAGLLSDRAGDFAEAWNFGPSPDAFVDVGTIARDLQEAWGPGVARIAFGRTAGDPHEAGMLTLDSSKAHVRLGWKPRLSTREAIAMTAQWYRAFAQGGHDMRALTIDQIARFASSDFSSPLTEEKVKACA